MDDEHDVDLGTNEIKAPEDHDMVEPRRAQAPRIYVERDAVRKFNCPGEESKYLDTSHIAIVEIREGLENGN